MVMRKKLRNRLPSASVEGLDALIDALESQGSKSTIQAFVTLLKESCLPAAIQSILLEYKDHALEKFTKSADLDKIKKTLLNFDRMQVLLLQAVDRHWQAEVNQLESRLLDAGNELLMTSARNQWIKDGEVELYNYYWEVPVIARVKVHQIRENGMSVLRTPKLMHVIAAGQHGQFAHIRLPDHNLCLRMAVESTHGQLVHLKPAGIFQVARERRRHIRVLYDKHIGISIRDSSGEKLQATLQNLSQSGFDISMQQELSANVGDSLGYHLLIRSNEIDGTFVIRWMHKSKGYARLGVELDMDTAIEHKLQIEVAHRQKQILNALKMHGTPDCLFEEN